MMQHLPAKIIVLIVMNVELSTWYIYWIRFCYKEKSLHVKINLLTKETFRWKNCYYEKLSCPPFKTESPTQVNRFYGHQFLHCKPGDEQKKSKILNFCKETPGDPSCIQTRFRFLMDGSSNWHKSGKFWKPRKTQIMPLPLHCFSPFIQVTRNNKFRKTVI